MTQAVYDRIRVEDHVCTDQDNLVHVGDTSRGTPVWLDKRAMACDHIVLTGGVIYSQAFRQLLLSRISYLGRVICKPGEEEMDSLAYYLNAVLTGELQPKEYN